MKKLLSYFTLGEKLLWTASVLLITVSFVLFDRESYLTLAASLIGVTSLVLNAKGNPIGQLLMVVFSILYGVISYDMAYYGEMVTYLGMTAPMALFALIAWIRHPFDESKTEVAVNHLRPSEYLLMTIPVALVTWIFYHILAYFDTANIIPSTLSVTTSFIPVYLTARRSEYYALGYAANDVVLIVLWTLASLEDTRYISVVACFVAFLFNDLYGFIAWSKMKKRQMKSIQKSLSRIS